MAKILVIDDSVSVLEHLKVVLSDAGHEVATADSGGGGLERLWQESVDLVITDMYMPGEDGVDVIRQTRILFPGIKLIAMSSRTSELNLFSVAKALGAAATLQKPFKPEELIQAVNAALAASSTQSSAAGLFRKASL
jgi:DNA-binding response OmpR family regulator